ncbi:MAG TPA: septal ring lytic transglycosylase RlpA family protein [Anaeromyxobacteraceae bacterium]|nr:septal ring lytic transglycosylase RlpA family protein [Anaeromyxobacteraceae bacterium]
MTLARRASVAGPALALLVCAGGCAHAPRSDSGRETGLASYQGREAEGRSTASGRPYRSAAMTCAHRTQPFGAVLRVVDLETGRAVDVEVIDRGPFVEGRIVDLSLAAARELGIVGRGLARVRVTRLR